MPYIWHGEYWCEAADRGAWRAIQNPIEREEAEHEYLTKASEQDRTVRALLDAGFQRSRFPIRRGERWIRAGDGWVRWEGTWREYTNAEAVAWLNEAVGNNGRSTS